MLLCPARITLQKRTLNKEAGQTPRTRTHMTARQARRYYHSNRYIPISRNTLETACPPRKLLFLSHSTSLSWASMLLLIMLLFHVAQKSERMSAFSAAEVAPKASRDEAQSTVIATTRAELVRRSARIALAHKLGAAR